MLYQKMFTGPRPYAVHAGTMTEFREHRHPEMELSYCLKGEYSVFIDRREYRLGEGDLALMDPMAVHAFRAGDLPNRALTVEVGPAFLGECFSPFARASFTPAVIRPEGETAEILRELSLVCKNFSEVGRMTVQGLLFRLCALLLRDHLGQAPEDASRLREVAKVEQALTVIHSRYGEPVTVGEVAAQCGYSESAFCKAFRRVTGETFHRALNRRRVEMARYYLQRTALPVEQIAVRVGFADAKSFCRVFGGEMGCSPGSYRKQQRE